MLHCRTPLFMQAIPLIATLCLAACGHDDSAPVVDRGWQVYGYASHISCGTLPVLLNGNRMDLTVDGACSRVEVAGDHNDISINMVPGGEIRITGSHNDVTWHLPPGVRGTPLLIDKGDSNTFHRPG